MITVNSPGEVSGWLKPTVKALKALWREIEIVVFIPPCTFASGVEQAVVEKMPEVSLVVKPHEVVSFVLLGKFPANFTPAKQGIVLFLGGDLTYAKLIAKRLKYPAVAYTEGFANWIKSFQFFAEPYPKMQEKLLTQGVPREKVFMIGNLMLDAAKAELSSSEVRQRLKIKDRPLILLLPGSRPGHVRYFAPFLMRVAELIREKIPEAAFVLSISPFVSDFQLQEVLNSEEAAEYEGRSSFVFGKEVDGATAWDKPGLITTTEGLEISALRNHQYNLMAAADLAVTIPGTNSIELSFFGVPMIVAMPLNRLEIIPLEGIPGLIGALPVVGKLLKQWLIPKLATKIKYTAWPNMLAEDELVPEIRGILTPKDLAEVAFELLADPIKREEISLKLKVLVGETGAAERLVTLMEKVMLDYYKEG